VVFYRSISFQLYASGLLLRDGNCVGYLPQFAQKQPVTISVLQMGIVSFVVDKKVILEFNIELPSGTVGQLSVCCCGGGVSRIGSPILDTKELFVIEFYQSPLSSSNFPFTIIQSAMQKHFTSLQDRLRFASFAYSLSQILSSSVLKLSGHGLSLIQVRPMFSRILHYLIHICCSVPQTKWFLICFVLMALLVYHAYLTKCVSFMPHEF
jgi:hypothetical protein